AVEFCNALSREEGLKPYYRIDGSGKGRTVSIPDRNGPGYRLPTEAEWEYACRAGSTALFSHGFDTSKLRDHAWYGQDSQTASTYPVGLRKANEWGLYDIHGNVWEWCEDWYDEAYYGQGFNTDPFGPAMGKGRVMRGGSVLDTSSLLRCARRSWS